MVNFFKKSQQKFGRLRKPLQHEIEILAAILALFFIIVPIVGVFNAREGEKKAADGTTNYETLDGFNGLLAIGYVPFVDPNNYNYRVNLRFLPLGNYSQEGGRGQLAVPVQIKVNGRKLEPNDQGDFIPPQDFTFTFSDGKFHHSERYR